eukprot:scaffold1706_cov113-Isochrysis_galbana.AAC.6
MAVQLRDRVFNIDRPLYAEQWVRRQCEALISLACTYRPWVDGAPSRAITTRPRSESPHAPPVPSTSPAARSDLPASPPSASPPSASPCRFAGRAPSTCRQGIRVDGAHKAIVGAPAVAQSLLNGECRRRVSR